MKPINFEGARQHILNRLEHELPPNLFYHSLAHTRDDVTPAAFAMAQKLHINWQEQILILTAALYHDIGFIQSRENHEEISAQIAEQELPQFDYSQQQIQIIRGMIMATHLPQTPHTLLEQIIADADLDSLGREDFFITSLNLKAELAAFGMFYTDEEWYRGQYNFLKSHAYFTSAATEMREAGKQRNISLVKERLSSFSS